MSHLNQSSRLHRRLGDRWELIDYGDTFFLGSGPDMKECLLPAPPQLLHQGLSPRLFVKKIGSLTALHRCAGRSCLDYTFWFALLLSTGLSGLVPLVLTTLMWLGHSSSASWLSATRKDWIRISMVLIDTTVEQGKGHLHYSGGFSLFECCNLPHHCSEGNAGY